MIRWCMVLTMNDADGQYLNLLRTVLNHGTYRMDRTGVGTKSFWGYQMRFDLGQGFPLLTTKRVYTRGVVAELLWMMQGFTDVQWLRDRNVTIWDEWELEDGTIGPGYGAQYRNWLDASGNHHDQLADVYRGLRKDPFSRRHIVSAWNVGQLSEMALPPCHLLYQFSVQPDADGKPERLSCALTQRSGDIFLGVPFNIAYYSLMTHIFAEALDLKPGTFVHSINDAHLYVNHLDQALEQLSREPKGLPTVSLDANAARERDEWIVEPDGGKGIPLYDVGDIAFQGYDPHPAIKAPVAV